MILSFAASIAQIFLSFGLGWSVAYGRSSQDMKGEVLFSSVLAGIFIETMILFLLLLAGISLEISVLTLLVAAVAGVSMCLWKKKEGLPRFNRFSLKWYEIALILIILGKIMFALAMLWQTPLLFEDAMTHWSGRARSLYGGVNWSFDPDSPVFLGFTGAKHYPLGIPLYRAATAVIGGGWDDFIARADGLVFYGMVIATVWLTVRRFSGQRWLAAAGAFVAATLPLQVIHAVSGYSDIAVEAFFVGAVAMLLRGEWFIAGLLAAGTAWMKNDGLVIAIPPLIVMAGLLLGSDRCPLRSLGRKDAKNILLFLSGLLPLSPWLVFKAFHGLGITPGGQSFSYHSEAWPILRDAVLLGPTHSIFWLFTIIVLLACGREYFRDRKGLALLALFALSMISVLFVFICTDAYAFLENQTTIHRTMLQLYGMTIIVVFYGIHLNLEKIRVAALDPDKAKKSRRQKKR